MSIQQLSVQILSALGPKTGAAVKKLSPLVSDAQLNLIAAPAAPERPNAIELIGDALNKGWSDDDAAEILEELVHQYNNSTAPEPSALAQWIRVHQGDARAVVDCMSVLPPEEITILKLLSRAGNQKLVFLAKWHLAQRDIVLKRFIENSNAAKLLARELLPHPLTMVHPNIIETHLLKNRRGEQFLAERRLPTVLDDSWRAHGAQEAANLLRDIASALAFLQTKQLVHGDVKPDNIGREAGCYLLLDFGICRSAFDFSADTPPTGSLRTRAPELLEPAGRHSEASDIWALGATVFNAVVGRFPLFDDGEAPPRVSQPQDRAAFERTLLDRAQKEWQARVRSDSVPAPLQSLLEEMLDQDPRRRPTAAAVQKRAESDLAAFLRTSETDFSLSPAEEVDQLSRDLASDDAIRLMPDNQRSQLRELLRRLGEAKGLDSSRQAAIVTLQTRIPD